MVKENEVFCMGVSRREVQELLNMPNTDFNMEDVLQRLVDQNRFNPWLHRMKHGEISTSRVVSDIVEKEFKKYQAEKEKIMPLVEELDITPSDYKMVSKEKQKSSRDHNEIRKKVIVKCLKKRHLLEKEMDPDNPQPIIDEILREGGVEAYIEKNFADLAKSKSFKRDYSDDIAEAVLSTAKEENKRDRGKKKFASRKRRGAPIANHKPKNSRSR